MVLQTTRVAVICFLFCIISSISNDFNVQQAAFAQSSERGKFILYKYQHPMGEENYEITSQDDSLVLKTSFELTFVGDKVPVTTTLQVKQRDYSPLKFESKGRTSTRTEIDVAVEFANGTAIVRNGQQTKTEKIPGKFFTVAHPASVAPQMMLFRYWKRNNPPGRIPILPGGTVKIDFLGNDKIRIGEREETLERYCIEGVMWGCETVWFDKNQNLIALVGADAEMDRFEAVREGYESALQFFVKQGAEDAVRQLERWNQNIKPLHSGRFAITGVLLIDGRGGEPISNSVVIVENGRIVSVGNRETVTIPKGYKIHEARGKTLLPGLFDMHAHATQAEWFPASLAAGITTKRDAANELEFIVPIRDAIKAGRALGPRLLLAGYIDSGKNPLGRMRAETPDDARRIVNEYKRAGFEQIKIYQSLKPELVKVVAEEAHRLGMSVTGHVPSGMNIYAAVENGFDQVNHINFAFRAMLPKTFKPQPGQPPRIEPEADVAQEGLQFLREHKTIVEPTLARAELNFHGKSRPFDSIEPGMSKLPYELASLINTMGISSVQPQTTQFLDLTFRVTKALHKAGIPLIVGTDLAVPGHSEFRELELLVKAGLTPMEAIQAATINPARAMKLEKELGTIESGKIADLILVDGNPIESISNIRKVKFVVTNGRMYDTAILWQSVRFQN
jgi:imidazolonepropionase-like amidohydrolase